MSKELVDEISNILFLLMPKFKKKLFTSSLPKGILPPSHFHVIMYLDRNGSASVSDIADFLGVSRPNMTPIINNLISEGLVERVPDPNDRRIIRIVMTEKAAELLNYQKDKIKAGFAEKISILDEKDLLELKNSLTKITDIIEKID